MKILVVFDDTGRKSDVIKDIIGDRGFSEVLVRKVRLEDRYRETLKSIFPDLSWRTVVSNYEYADLMRVLQQRENDTDTRVLHCFSNFVISDPKAALLSYQKTEFIEEPFTAYDGRKAVAALFPDTESYLGYLNRIISGEKAWDAARSLKQGFPIEGVIDISEVSNFIRCLTGNLDSRYFNTLQGDAYTLVKTSPNIEKIKKEYTYYTLLPEDMKHWFVMPFSYRETEREASYSMERLHMTDVAVKWVHGSIGEEEFEKLMEKYFYFFRSRHEKTCTEEEYRKAADELYREKVLRRVEQLKGLDGYQKIAAVLGSMGESIDSLTERYFALREKVEKRCTYQHTLVLGHGDPCFSNTLYSRATETLKFIDPKGALTEEEMWTNPYYDVAKLSHSVCGDYDFFNSGMFDIKVSENFDFEIELPFDHAPYVRIFRDSAEKNGYDFLSVRLYEASLFLSMLPLHMDNPYKVLGFALNLKTILKEIENDV